MPKSKKALFGSAKRIALHRDLKADLAVIEAWGGIDVWVRAYDTTPEQVKEWIATGAIWQMPATIEHIMLAILKLTPPPEGGIHA